MKKTLILLGLAIASSTSPAFAEPEKPAGRTRSWQVQLATGTEFQVRIHAVGSAAGNHFRGIFKDLSTSSVCTFEEKEDYFWWQSSLSIGCSGNRLELRTYFPALTGSSSIESLATMPVMQKLFVGKEVHTWVSTGAKVLDPKALKAAQSELRKMPAEFLQSLRDLRLLSQPEFSEANGPSPSLIDGVAGILDDTPAKVRIASIVPLSSDESDGLVREAAASK